MEIKIRIEPEDVTRSIQRMIEVLLPGYHLRAGEPAGAQQFISLQVSARDLGAAGIDVRAMATIHPDGQKREELNFQEKDILDPRYLEGDRRRRLRDVSKKAAFLLLERLLDRNLNPWGILIGVRPTKLVHYLRGKGFSFPEIGTILQDLYCLRQDKQELLLEVARREEAFLPRPGSSRKVSIYIGIPFCPTRCGYCSFPAYPRARYKGLYGSFCSELLEEVRSISRVVRDLGLEVDTIYLGGGTPTALDKEDLAELLQLVTAGLYGKETREFCLEAGRPDTLSGEVLELIASFPIDRLTINPQTMNQVTLDRIGRAHTVAEVESAFSLAREKGIRSINTDIIVGLPGEGRQDVETTLKRLLALKPQGVTVHTLALKRGSRWVQQGAELDLPAEEDVEEMLEMAGLILGQAGFLPYYLYRQKYMLGNMENTGFALPGHFGLYNMIMMEERETVLGLGGGAITKFVDGYRVERIANPKFPGEYVEKRKELTAEKLSKLTSLHQVG
ncbi:MAG: coproporphyrinogen dehydrogenase HemZ [Halanaerobium sp.]|nr:coproporphyrinogen dehydrogenase HemZ [Halanaerobium sp.]